MIKLTEEQIIDGQNEAYLKAGQNAYFGNGFNAGVEFALKQVNKLAIPLVSNQRELLLDYERFTSLRVLGKEPNRSSKLMVEDYLKSNNCG